MPRLVCPSWRWMTISGTPSRAISTAWAWRSWCGAKRRRTPASRATRRSSVRGGGGRPRPSAPGVVDDAQQGADRQLDPGLKPRLELLPGPVVDADLAAAAALAAAHQQRSASRGERERLVNAQAGAPQHDDQAAQPAAVDAVAGVAHHRDDFLDRR